LKVAYGAATPVQVREGTVLSLPGPATVVFDIPTGDDDGSYTYVVAEPGAAHRMPDEHDGTPVETAAQLAEIARHNIEVANGYDFRLSHLPDHEALIVAVAVWNSGQHAVGQPSWVWSDNPDFAVLLGEYFHCPVGMPDDVEATHYTSHAGVSYPPGSTPPVEVTE